MLFHYYFLPSLLYLFFIFSSFLSVLPYRWIEERRSRRKVVENTDNYVQDEAVVNNMFFAQQVGGGNAGAG